MKSFGRNVRPHHIQGITCLVLGAVCNKFVFEALFSSDGKISALPVNIALVVLQICLISAGLLLLVQQYKYLAMIGVGLLLLFVLQFWVRLLMEAPFQTKRMFKALPKPLTVFEAGFDYRDQISIYEARFADLKAMLPASGTVGYITSDHLSREHAKFHWGLTTYALVPLQVERTTSHPFIVGNFPDIDEHDSLPMIENATLVKNFGNGVMLFIREDMP